MLKKESVCRGKAGGWQLSVGERRTRLPEGLRDREGGCNQRAPSEEEEILNTNKKRWKGMKYWRVRKKEPGQTTQSFL